MMLLAVMTAQAQINIQGSVYGGARQADVGGSTNVTIGAELHDVVIDAVYGGSDVSGRIGTLKGNNDTSNDANVKTIEEDKDKKFFIGQVYGGGNGDYDYVAVEEDDPDTGEKIITHYEARKKLTETTYEVVATSTSSFVKPEIKRVSLDIEGGTFGYVFGGGNAATVTEVTDIKIDNQTTEAQRTKIKSETGGWDLLDNERLKDMGINYLYYNNTTKKYLFSRVFGGNNKADMAIRPTWNLLKGSIQDLYSGGNEGRMTNKLGLLLEIGKKKNDGTIESSDIEIYNVYGGCRKADVRPLYPEAGGGHQKGDDVASNEITINTLGYNFPAGLPARLLIRSAKKITNVYGGNDVTGRVYGGNAVGVYTTISGNIYGGGNGSYAYTDNDSLKNDLLYGDFYYDVNEVKKKEKENNSSFSYTDETNKGLTSVEALNLFRPNAEQVSILVRGTEDNRTIIRGSIYCGGNSATLKKDPNKVSAENKNYPLVELKVGSYVIADNVFLGNNGENMVTNDILSDYAGTVRDAEYDVATEADKPSHLHDFSQMTLTNDTQFSTYMDGCAMDLIPTVTFDDLDRDGQAYKPYTSYFGSFFLGGNVGSMTYQGVNEMDFDVPIYIYNKVVGGCNNAYVQQSNYNAAYYGGIRGTTAEQTSYMANGKIKDRLILNLGGKVISTGDTGESSSSSAVRRGVQIMPLRWPEASVDGVAGAEGAAPRPIAGVDLVWNTVNGLTEEKVAPPTDLPATEGHIATDADKNRRFDLGNIYGGCYTSGHVNGNVVINLNATIVDRDKLFDVVETDDATGEANLYGHDSYKITKRRGGVILDEQGMDVLGKALNVFGGGMGEDTEIWGSTTINLNQGYTFQIFGGSQKGTIGKRWNATNKTFKTPSYDEKYSCTINVHGQIAGDSKKRKDEEGNVIVNNDPRMAEAEFIYGGGFEGPIMGNTTINLGNGRVFNTFAGSCNADIYGHTETYIGRSGKVDNNNKPILGFPWVRDYTYGGNDLGGQIRGNKDFSGRVRNDVKDKVYKDTLLTANAYTEYIQGRVLGIFAGCYGSYNYADTNKFGAYVDTNGDPINGFHKPYLANAFVNFRPEATVASITKNKVYEVYGAGQGYSGEKDMDKMQDRSYVLIDIPQTTPAITNYANMQVWGGGAYGGIGMGVDHDKAKTVPEATAVIDLVNGKIAAAYGGSYKEGITRRTEVNVPKGSTIEIGSIFGGAYGTHTLPPCDVYESHVNYRSGNALLVCDPKTNALYQGALYGGNNKERRTLYAHVDVYAPVEQRKVIQYKDEVDGMEAGDTLMTKGTVYGAGRGENTWSEYTEVNLESGAEVYEVYGGGQLGHVLNAETVQKYMQTYKTNKPDDIPASDFTGDWVTAWKKAWTFDDYYTPNDNFDNYVGNTNTNYTNVSPRTELDAETAKLLGDGTEVFNTNVIIKEGATVHNYAYGGGLGKAGIYRSGDVWGTTYIALLGGTVKKDLYAAGTRGGVYDAFQTKTFTASANAYIKGGTARNVYGGGWKGSVGKHTKIVNKTNEEGEEITVDGQKVPIEVDANIDDSYENDIYGETHVVIGDLEGTSFTNGLPAIERNAYGGGEGGAVFGTTHLTMRNGFIGYRHFDGVPTVDTDLDYINVGSDYYQEKLHDETWSGDGTNRLDKSGSIYGGGYVDNSSVDKTVVRMYSGHVRNALFGGGEIAAIGRGIIEASGEDKSVRTLIGIYKAGKTLVELYDGHVHRNVFGGGRGYNNLGEHGTLYSDGYVFGQTEVHIYGGEVGTEKELAFDNGNVFGGGDIGYVYSAYELADGTLRRGIQGGARYDGLYEGYYYEHKGKTKTQSDETVTRVIDTNTTEPSDYSDGVYTDASGFIMYPGKERKFTEDCKVLIEPHCKVKPGNPSVTFTLKFKQGNVISSDDFTTLEEYNENHPNDQVDIEAIRAKVDSKGRVTDVIPEFNLKFFEGEYVPTFALNSLGNRSDTTQWLAIDANTDDDGVLIHNAVFAGGNTSSGSSTAYANATSVFGNATASVHDIYNRDLISIGTGREGGLYGDGNLTFVDGYRELNITNYGTDYYYLYDPQRKEITYQQYLGLLKREQDYYEVRYECTRPCTDKDGTNYYPQGNGHSQASTLSADDILTLFKNVANPDYDPKQPISDNNKEYLYTVPSNFYNIDGSINTDPSNGYWKQNGVCSIYAGRFMNTIQRADFCGVFGSRMVMQGAEDRVPEVTDYTLYTLNRVREVSLNKKVSRQDNTFHGNYFGIYSVVNFLGALTSDVNFTDKRTTDNTNSEVYGPDYDPTGATITITETNTDKIAKILEEAAAIDGVSVSGSTSDPTITASTVEGLYRLRSVSGLNISASPLSNQTFYNWKALHHDEQKRNNGTSHNKVALASGVYLELTTEKSTGKEIDEKDWGLITGIVELDLINVQPGMGGGFVYAKNVHGECSGSGHTNTTMSALNVNAVTQWDFDYKDPEKHAATYQKEWQTSGNFVHSTQTIIDDCYNVSGKYLGPDRVPAHYWYIKGNIYVYDQYISAYTGVSNAYSETVDIPLTISAASNGTMTLLQVQPNKYAYLNTNGAKLGENTKLVINGIEYYLNDPINYWEWNKLTPSEKNLFVDETYVVTDSCKIGSKYYAPGYVMLPDEYTRLSGSAIDKDLTPNDNVNNPVKAVLKATKDADGNDMVVKDDKNQDVYIAFDAAFHESNNLSHETGYMLTYKVNNPVEWNTWYTQIVGNWNEKNQTSSNDTENYRNGPTFHIEGAAGKVLGQRDYKKGDLITDEVYYIYNGVGYRCKQDCEDKDGNKYWKGETMSKSAVEELFAANVIASSWEEVNDPMYPGITNHITNADDQADFVPAMIMTEEKTVTDSNGATYHLYPDHVVSAIEVADLGLSGSVADAYICSKSIQLSATEFIYINTKMTLAKKQEYSDSVTADIRAIIPSTKLTDARLAAIKKFSDLTDDEKDGLTPAQVKEVTSLLAARSDIDEYIVRAYYCTEAGRYGGNYYSSGYNYRGLEAFSSMKKSDREEFTYNYDALDLLVDPTYGGTEGQKYQYDSTAGTLAGAGANPAQYSLETPIDYTATYNGSETETYNGIELKKDKEYTRQEYESLPNERRHYAPIMVEQEDVTNHTKFYVVHKSGLVVGNTPYPIGSVLDPDDYSTSISSYVTELTFTNAGTYYYCRESYEIGEKGSGKPVINRLGTEGYDKEGNSVAINTTAYTNGQTVPIGLIISEGTDDGSEDYSYKSLVNKQLNFTIHGKAPTETSTFYVSRFSDIKDLSTEKIITVIYRYDYEESDKLGNHITPVSERHIVNIHINFKSGLPEVEDIKAPKIILPGDKVGLSEPRVIPGANEIITGGWELYQREEDAENRANGIPYEPGYDPLYWYQDGYYVRYYCLTNIGGKSYSNYVPVSVANYHDLKKVMEDKNYHYYVDNPDVKRASKIYINDYSNDQTGSKNGLDLLKDFFDLSVLDNPATDKEGLITGDDFTGHKPLDSHVRAGRNLHFILRTDIDHSGSTWSPIGNNNVSDNPDTPNVDEALSGDTKGECFDGTLHGDGHHLSGLTNSLFAHLCGNVYNLGVSGSFTGGGIADEGDGYVENCWVMTTEAPADDTYAIFGKATDPAKQIENCYYLETNNYKATTDARPMPAKAFYNGEVTYDLNGFYLHKRYYDNASWSGTKKSYSYLPVSTDGTLPEEMTTGYYPDTYAYYPITSGERLRGYVEQRFHDGDFRYAGGKIPEDTERRMRMVTVTESGTQVEKPYFAPIWPNDYFFFGQALNYDYDGLTHQDVPSSYAATNRVFRAPAYYGLDGMGVAHFNPDAIFAQTKNNNSSVIAYKGMTAIDFTGGNGDLSGGYKEGLADASGDLPARFFPPLLDDWGLNSFKNIDLTQNLLVYTGTSTDAALKTDGVISSVLTDEAYSETDATYRTVDPVSQSDAIMGHWVQKQGDNYVALKDHLLIDKQDFFCPIPYTFTDGSGDTEAHRMWYQRTPDNYVDLTKGWECISLPFTADVVTTQTKGELTHFFSDNTTGHEYWLRKFIGIVKKDNELSSDTKTIYISDFNYPTANNSDPSKLVENTFLWDYYYKGYKHDHKDLRDDTYQTYYNHAREYDHYPRLTNGVPYLIGFPGETYYEFDLSGSWIASTTAADPFGVTEQQVITFASKPGVTIYESKGEMGVTTATDGLIFKPNYLNQDFGETASSTTFTLKADGSSFVNKATSAKAFRPYITGTPTPKSGGRTRGDDIEIIFGKGDGSFGVENHDNPSEKVYGTLKIYPGRKKIVVESSLSYTANVRILNPAGVTVKSFSIEPGETIETLIINSGVYIVTTDDRYYIKKLSVR